MSRSGVAWLAGALLLAACGNQPRVPDWQLNARGALERYQAAWLAGNARAAQAEFSRARSELSATGDASLVARAELTRCALQVASLVFEPCAGFEPLRADAAAPERAYADYLAGRALVPAAQAALPAQHRAVAAWLAAAPPASAAPVDALAAIEDPLARLVASGVVLRSGRADGRTLEQAAEVASGQGWRQPLLAWLGALRQRALQAGATGEADRLARRIDLAAGTLSSAPAAPGASMPNRP